MIRSWLDASDFTRIVRDKGAMKMKGTTKNKAIVFAGCLVMGLALSSSAVSGDLPKLIKDGAYKCQVSKEYKFRGCKVTTEGDNQFIELTEDGHLLMMRGPIFPTDHMGKKKTVFVEASLTGDQPYICGVKDSAAQAECKNQKVMIRLDKKGKVWQGSFALKHYWDKWGGEGAGRTVVGTQVTVETISFKLKK